MHVPAHYTTKHIAMLYCRASQAATAALAAAADPALPNDRKNFQHVSNANSAAAATATPACCPLLVTDGLNEAVAQRPLFLLQRWLPAVAEAAGELLMTIRNV